MVAALAADELNPQARAEMGRLLAGEIDPTLPGVANWADTLRENDPGLGKRSAKWHYVNLAEHDCAYLPARDCLGGNCVVEAIRAQAAILADRGQSDAARRQALKFVVHFVGDVHQPLHAGYARDHGGNDVQVNLDGRGSNLHALWDRRLLETTGLNEEEHLVYLRALPLAVPLSASPLPPDSASWAEQSCRVVREPGFYPDKARIGADYVERWRPIAEAQLRRAGTQLAQLLNAALGR